MQTVGKVTMCTNKLKIIKNIPLNYTLQNSVGALRKTEQL